jgi:hypothetical protein
MWKIVAKIILKIICVMRESFKVKAYKTGLILLRNATKEILPNLVEMLLLHLKGQ